MGINMNRKLARKLLAAILVFLMGFTDCAGRWIESGGLNQVAAAGQEEYIDYLTKAEALGTPLKVYNYLRNHINYEYYGGRRKGAEAVYDSLGGNDADQAVLFSRMLGHLGYDTRFVRGRIRLYPEQLRRLTGKTDMMEAADILALAGDTEAVCGESGDVLWVETDHVWVEAYVPYGNYRGNGNCAGTCLWIPLDTGIKQYESTETVYDRYGEYGINAVEPGSVSAGDVDGLNALFARMQGDMERLAAENGDLYLTRYRIAEEELDYLPLSLPYEVAEVYETFQKEENMESDSISFFLNGNRLTELTPEQMYGKRLVLAYEEEEGKLCGVLKLDGEALAKGAPVSPGQEESFRMDVKSAGEVKPIENTILAGGMYQITCDTQNITERELGLALNRWEDLQETADESNILNEETLGVFLDYVGKAYFAQVDLADRLLAEQAGIYAVRDLSVGIMGYQPDVRINAATNEKRLSGKGSLYADIDLDVHRTAGEDGAARQFMLLAGMVSSYYESLIWEQFAGLPAVSTTALFADAAEDGTDICVLTGANFEEEKGKLGLDAGTVRAIQQKTEEGKIVLAPCREQTVADWTGAGYLVLDRDSYAGEYMISGGPAGEGLGGGSSSTLVGMAYLLNLVLTAIDMAQAICMIPHILTLLSAATPLGFLTAIVVGSLVTALMVFSMMYLADTVALMDAYLEGDEGAGEAMVSSAVLNLATTAAVGLGTKAVGKAVQAGTKKLVGKTVGSEVAERLVEESTNTRGLVRSIGKLRDMGFADDVIREFAQNLETESFEKLGTLARKGMPAGMVEAFAGNGAAIRNVTDAAELLVFKDTARHADDVVRLIGEKGDDFVRVYSRFGDPAVDVLVRCGSGAVGEIDTYGARFIGLVDSYGDDFVGLYGKYGHTAVERCLERGDEVLELAGKYGDDCADLLMRYGDDVMEGISRHGDEFLERYAKEGDAFVEEYLEKGDAVFEGGRNFGFTVDEISNLKITVINEGQILKDMGLSNDQLGPAIAGAYDRTTGKIYTAINDYDGKLPIELAPIIRERIENMPPEVLDSYINTKGAGSHAEIYAVNKLLLDNPDAELSDIAIYVNRTLGTSKPVIELPFETCPHCQYILEGFNIISNN